MTDYTMIILADEEGLRWEYHFSMPSDALAIDYAKRHTARFRWVCWFAAILLYREDTYVGKFIIDAPTVTMR